MKFPVVLSIIAASVGSCLALEPIDEEFTGPTLDGTRWYHHQQNRGKLAQAGDKLNFVVQSAPTGSDFASIELLASQPGYNEGWEVILDLANTSGAGKSAGCGIMIFNVKDRSDYLFVDFYGNAGVAAGVLVDGDHPPKGTFKTNVGLHQASLRIRFDPDARLMTFSVSLTKPDRKYKWIELGTFSPTGKDAKINGKVVKVNAKANWKMRNADKFGVQLFGFGNSRKVGKGAVTIDNFVLTSRP